jgi:diguanylate cyclase (GGDEF)-like protein
MSTPPRKEPVLLEVEKTAEYPAVPEAPLTVPVPSTAPPEPEGQPESTGMNEAPSTEKALAIAARLGASRATLTVLTGVDSGQVISLDGPAHVLGRGPHADFSADDPGVSRAHAKLLRKPDGRFVLEDLGSTNGTFVGARRVKSCEIKSGERVQLGPNVLLRFAIVDDTEEEMQRRLYESSTRDALTHAYNRKYLMDRLIAEIAHARRHKTDLAVLMLDLDYFKKTNDQYGHLVGDHVLRSVAARLLKLIRIDDVFARYGGEEFVIVARATAHDDAVRFAERARVAIEEMQVHASIATIRVTMSIGLASIAECEGDAGALLALADARLYRAKTLGRNRVCASS